MLRQSSSTCSFLPFPQSSHSESLSPPHHNPLRSRGIASLLGVEMIKKMISTYEGVGTDPSLCIRRKKNSICILKNVSLFGQGTESLSASFRRTPNRIVHKRNVEDDSEIAKKLGCLPTTLPMEDIEYHAP